MNIAMQKEDEEKMKLIINTNKNNIKIRR